MLVFRTQHTLERTSHRAFSPFLFGDSPVWNVFCCCSPCTPSAHAVSASPLLWCWDSHANNHEQFSCSSLLDWLGLALYNINTSPLFPFSKWFFFTRMRNAYGFSHGRTPPHKFAWLFRDGLCRCLNMPYWYDLSGQRRKPLCNIYSVIGNLSTGKARCRTGEGIVCWMGSCHGLTSNRQDNTHNLSTPQTGSNI